MMAGGAIRGASGADEASYNQTTVRERGNRQVPHAEGTGDERRRATEFLSLLTAISDALCRFGSDDEEMNRLTHE